MRARHLAMLLATASVAGALAVFGCSLGLDPSLMNQQDSGASDAMTAVDGDAASTTDGPVTSKDSTAGGDGTVPIGASQCATDKDCQSAAGDAGVDAGGCAPSATCDKTWHVCMLEVCPTSACNAAVCVTSTNTCSLPASYGFQPGTTGSFPVQYGGVGPAGPGGSIAAVWPFVFVVTTNGVVAYDVVDPTSSSPPVVSVHGVPFIPDSEIAVGRRVYFVRGPEGGPTTFHYAIAWIDVPQNPFLTDFQASSAWVSSTTKSFDSVLTNGVDGLFFVYDTADQLWDSANVHPPLGDSTTITTSASLNFPMNAAVWGSTGTRLYTARYDSTVFGYWGALVTAAGTVSAQATAEQQIGAAIGEYDSQAYVTTGGDGSVLASLAPYAMSDAGPTGISSACLSWWLDKSTSGNFDASTCWPLETYAPPPAPPPSGLVVGRPGWVDANTALGLAGAASNPAATTSVHVVKKTSGAVAGQVAALPVGPALVGMATSHGFGYALTQDDPMNQTCTVYIFAPSCGAD